MPLSLILAVILLITCSGCFWGWEHDHGGYGKHDHGGHGEHKDQHKERR